MPRTTAALVAMTSLLGAGLLAGCEKPPPGVTVWSGSDSVRSEALCWAFESDQLQPGECAEEILQGTVTSDDIGSLELIPGDFFGISVDPAVADSGWTVRIGQEALTPTPLTSTYFRFQVPQNVTIPQEGFALQVVAGQDTRIRGVFAARLVPNGE